MTAQYRYPIMFDKSFMEVEGRKPKGTIVVTHTTEQAVEIVQHYLASAWQSITRKPTGSLKHPFLVPGALYEELWDWDAFFAACSLPNEGVSYGLGSILNLLDGVTLEGRPPKMASARGHYVLDAHPIPLFAQFAYIMARRQEDVALLKLYWNRLEMIVRWFEAHTLTGDRYFTWMSNNGNGIDNNPSVYGRPPRSSAGIDLASWHYREYRAMAKIAAALGEPNADQYLEKADTLREFIQTRYWDHIDRFFYSIDRLIDPSQLTLQRHTWETFLKFRNWASLFPLWAGIATPEQATYVVEKILSEEEFLSIYGLRSHSAIDPLYNNVPMGNPSNWQGPVWGLSTFVTSYALARYGYQHEAIDVSARLIRTFAADIEQNGTLHEFYHGDTGQPLISPDFISWNLLGLNVIGHLQVGQDSTTLDLLD